MIIKKTCVIAVAAGAIIAAGVTSVQAGEWADACVETLEADGRDASGCSCLEEEIVANDLADEFLELAEIADPGERYDAASDDAKAAMDKCTR
ncbi:hypothetical protein [Hyphococcus luteus]|uniref:Secreted protein n=1 Tax=Hyphococcus luteus TaxID=2058213 RepID=A0A2S7K6S4_9PROT|nr:hypothetical protein [Marinicaulis flavus]PQA88158.1 hypothetical protein CW354_07545 [Marinicaulis flavus]